MCLSIGSSLPDTEELYSHCSKLIWSRTCRDSRRVSIGYRLALDHCRRNDLLRSQMPKDPGNGRLANPDAEAAKESMGHLAAMSECISMSVVGQGLQDEAHLSA